MTTPIANRIKTFNEQAGKYRQLTIHEKASPEQVAALQQHAEIPIPEDLKSFYLDLGGLTPYDYEGWCLKIDAVPYLLERLNDPDKWGRCRSLGLIDYIRFAWVNDRIELDEDEYLTGEQIDLLNKSYKCFGLYRTDWLLEESDYLYFDRDGKFGTVRYHQDYIHELVPRLLSMLEKSPATEDLEGMLLRIMDTLENGILSEKDKEDQG